MNWQQIRKGIINVPEVELDRIAKTVTECLQILADPSKTTDDFNEALHRISLDVAMFHDLISRASTTTASAQKDIQRYKAQQKDIEQETEAIKDKLQEMKKELETQKKEKQQRQEINMVAELVLKHPKTSTTNLKIDELKHQNARMELVMQQTEDLFAQRRNELQIVLKDLRDFLHTGQTLEAPSMDVNADGAGGNQTLANRGGSNTNTQSGGTRSSSVTGKKRGRSESSVVP